MKTRALKRGISILTAAFMVCSVAGCGGKEPPADTANNSSMFETITEEKQPEAPAPEPEAPVEEPEAPVEEPKAVLTIPDGMYASELTGFPVSEELKNQRPIAVMVDNEVDALPHFGTAFGDVVYEMMNSTANNRITRLMVLVKDYDSVEQLGSIRSTRPTNILLAAEWNAVLCHDGGPAVHINPYFARGFVDHFSGTFSRVNNGKKREYTEYILHGDLDSAANFGSGKVSKEYGEGFSGDTPHFNFVEYGHEIDLESKYEKTYHVKQVILPFPHNSSILNYNDDTECYEYCEYGKTHVDEDSGATLEFVNVFLQKCSFTKLDENGYLIYNCLGTGEGFYLTSGICKSVSWAKHSDQDFTRFYDDNGDEIEINRGKTYIALVPDDTWDTMKMGEYVS